MIAQIFRHFLYGLLVYALLIFSHSAYSQSVDPIKVIEYSVRYSEGASSNLVYSPWRLEPWTVADAAQAYCAINNAANGNNAWNGVYNTASPTQIRCYTGSFNNYFYITLYSRNSTACPAGTHFDSAGKCVPDSENQCQSKQGQVEVSDYAFSLSNDSENAGSGDVLCIDGCRADVVFSGEPRYNCGFSGSGFGSCFTVHNVQSVFNGDSCSGNNPSKHGPDLPSNRPPCSEGQGVITSTSGNVMCLPPGTPNVRKPDVQVKEKKETFPDGTEKTTTTKKTTDPKTGASDTKTTTTTTGGMSGSAGTGTSQESSSGGVDSDCEGEDCSGDSKFTGKYGDLYEKGDRTIEDVMNEFIEKVKNGPAISKVVGWFSINGMPASCGGMSFSIPLFGVTLSLDEYLCGASAHLIMQIAAYVILALAAYTAFRIAYL